MDSGKVAGQCETHSRHAICSPVYCLFCFCPFQQICSKWSGKYLLYGNIHMWTTSLLKQEVIFHCSGARWQPVSCWIWRLSLWRFYRRIIFMTSFWKPVFFAHGIYDFCYYPCSPGAVQLAWQVQKTTDCIHKSAAAGAGASVQAK